MGIQVKAFMLLFAALVGWDAYAYEGEYRSWVFNGISRSLGSVHGLGPGRDWSKHKPARDKH